MARLKKNDPFRIYKNLKIQGPIKEVWDYKAFVLAYDGVLDDHYVNYVLFTDKDGEIKLFGGAANDGELPVSFAGAEENPLP